MIHYTKIWRGYGAVDTSFDVGFDLEFMSDLTMQIKCTGAVQVGESYEHPLYRTQEIYQSRPGSRQKPIYIDIFTDDGDFLLTEF